MIAIESYSGDLIKIITNLSKDTYGFHHQFGLIGLDRAKKLVEARKRQCYDFTRDKWHCSFTLAESKGSIKIYDLVKCSTYFADGYHFLDTPVGKFKLSTQGEYALPKMLKSKSDNWQFLEKLLYALTIITFILVPILFYLQTPPPVEEDIEEIGPITVQIIKPAHTVNVNKEVSQNIKAKPLTKEQISKRAVRRNLGFLGMLGHKDLSKVTGGIPQKLKQATAGAGPGGNAGSGGEVLTGLGKGLKKTTVGNSGMQGLGGIGTKGAGGGKGGYGNSVVASGEGKGISSIAISNSDLLLQGGLSRYAIKATIAKYLNEIRRCYEEQLKSNKNLQGLVEVSFEINATGRLNFANIVKSTLKNLPTENCIKNKMLAWEFPRPKGKISVPVKHPFMLRPVGL